MARPASIDAVRVREMKAHGLGATAIAKALGIGRPASIEYWKRIQSERCWLE
jgi:hypothetical protein